MRHLFFVKRGIKLKHALLITLFCLAFIGSPLFSEATTKSNKQFTLSFYKICLSSKSSRLKKLEEKTKEDFCRCWAQNLDQNLSENDKQLVYRAFTQPEFKEIYMDEHYPLASFDLEVAEKCLIDSNWRITTPKPN